MALYSRSLAPKGASRGDIVFLHGLLGSHMNLRTPAKKLGGELGCSVHLLDMPHHGKSASQQSDSSMRYADMAREVLSWMDSSGLEAAHLVGHSMGGKTAMAMALHAPERIQSALIVDIAPVNYNQHAGFALNTTIVDSLRRMRLDQLSSRQQADDALADSIPEPGIRAFVLMNLEQKPDNTFGWKVNLEAIAANLPNLASWEHVGGSFEGVTTFLGGSNSGYVQPDYHDAIHSAFPAAQIKMVPNAGHWIHAENPKLFHKLATAHFAPLT